MKPFNESIIEVLMYLKKQKFKAENKKTENYLDYNF